MTGVTADALEMNDALAGAEAAELPARWSNTGNNVAPPTANGALCLRRQVVTLSAALCRLPPRSDRHCCAMAEARFRRLGALSVHESMTRVGDEAVRIAPRPECLPGSVGTGGDDINRAPAQSE